MKALQVSGIAGTALLAACGGGGGGGGSTVELDEELGLGATNVSLDPCGTAPLSARLEFATPLPGRVTVTVVGKPLAPGDTRCAATEGVTISHPFTATASNFDLPILGL